MDSIEQRFFYNENPTIIESIGDYHIMQSETRGFGLGDHLLAYHVNEFPDGKKEAVVAFIKDSRIWSNENGRRYLIYESVREDLKNRVREEIEKRENISEIHFRKPAEPAR